MVTLRFGLMAPGPKRTLITLLEVIQLLTRTTPSALNLFMVLSKYLIPRRQPQKRSLPGITTELSLQLTLTMASAPLVVAAVTLTGQAVEIQMQKDPASN